MKRTIFVSVILAVAGCATELANEARPALQAQVCRSVARRNWGLRWKRRLFLLGAAIGCVASTACTPLDIASSAAQVATAYDPFDPTPTKQKTITIAPQTSTQAAASASTVPVPTALGASYLNVLDGNSIYPIEGTKKITLHPAPLSSLTTTSSGEIHNSRESARFTRVITATQEIDAAGQNFRFLFHGINDSRNVTPPSYQSILDQTPSFAGISFVAVVDSLGNVKSIHGAGGALDDPKIQQAMAQFSSGTYTGTIELPAGGMYQGSTLGPKLELLQDAEMRVFQTVEGHGTYRGRPVIVLKDDGQITRNGSAIGKVVGFAFLDESVGIVTYETDDISFQLTESGDTSTTQLHLQSSIDLP